MRLLQLGLLRFGPFTDVTLEFGAPGLHIVHGRNEAGKSTALRAITGLLFGIPERTTDAHLHPMDQLRIRGRLLGADGKELLLERRKGRKNTLLDREGQPVDETVIARLLGGVGRELFETTFGLDGARLRQGGEALLRGKGDVGQSLFDAAAGGHGVRRVIAELNAEADALYSTKSNASRKSINAGLKAYKEAEQRARHESMLPRAWVDQKKKLDAEQTLRDELDERKKRLQLERQRLERAVRALPKLERRAEVIALLQPLVHAPRLPPDAAERRGNLVARLSAASGEAARQAESLEELERERDGYEVPELLLQLDDQIVESLASRLASQHKADSDLRKLSGELVVAEADAQAAVRRLGRDGLAEAATFELTAAERARIGRLSRTQTQLDAALSESQSRLSQLCAEQTTLEQRLAELPDVEDFAPLEQALEAALRLGDIDATVRAWSSKHDGLRREMEVLLSELAAGDSAEAVLALPVPTLQTLETKERAKAQLDADSARIEERRSAHQEARARIQRELDALRRGGDVPTEQELARARAHRDDGWRRVRAAWRRPQPPGVDAEFDAERPLDEAFERTLHAADELGDRLRREAERAAKLASLQADEAALKEEASRLDEQAAEQQARSQAWQADWTASAPTPKLARLSPAELRGWLAVRGKLSDLARQLELNAAEQRESEAQRRAHAGALRRALREAQLPDDDTDLRPCSERAKAELARRRSLAERRARIEHDLERAVGQRAVLARAADERQRELAAWRKEWTAALTPLGLGADAGTDEAAAVLVLADELARKLETARGLERRIDGIERDARALEADVRDWVARHAPDLEGRSFQEAGAELVRRHQTARVASTRRQDVERRIHKLREQLVELREKRERADAELKALIATAGVSSAEELPAAEQASRRATELERELSTTERELGEIRAGVPVETLATETQGIDVDQARVRISEIERELEELEEQRDAVREQIATARAGLERLDNSTAAAEATAEAMAHAARIRQDVERYARVRLAEIVLSRQVERYREKNQGPLVERTSSLLPRLTHGRYAGVRVDVDGGDEPVLHCVRADGQLVDVEGLSEGTRDQLYLALRLASLERHAELGHPLPLVLDDVLVQFDEQRTAAALEALGELSSRLQILLFTHHDHVVEAARAVVPAEQLNVQTLTRPALAARAEPAVRA